MEETRICEEIEARMMCFQEKKLDIDHISFLLINLIVVVVGVCTRERSVSIKGRPPICIFVGALG